MAATTNASDELGPDEEIGKWHSCYDPATDEEIDWLMYIADMLKEEEDDQASVS